MDKSYADQNENSANFDAPVPLELRQRSQKWTSTRKAAFRAAVKCGMTPQEVAGEFGLSKKFILELARNFGTRFPRASSWTAEREAKLKDLAAAGMSASEIAVELGGITRNAVIGKCHRDGIKLDSGYRQGAHATIPDERLAEVKGLFANEPTITVVEAAQKLGLSYYATRNAARRVGVKLTRGGAVGSAYRNGARYAAGWHQGGGWRLKTSDPVPPGGAIFDNAIPVEQRKQLWELGRGQCHWPVGEPGTPDFFFCGAASFGGRPYCYDHCCRAYAR